MSIKKEDILWVHQISLQFIVTDVVSSLNLTTKLHQARNVHVASVTCMTVLIAPIPDYTCNSTGRIVSVLQASQKRLSAVHSALRRTCHKSIFDG